MSPKLNKVKEELERQQGALKDNPFSWSYNMSNSLGSSEGWKDLAKGIGVVLVIMLGVAFLRGCILAN